MKKNNFTRGLRLIILLGLLAFVTYEGYMHQVLGGGKVPSVHALCPFGALESLYSLLFMGSFIRKIFSGTVVLLILTVIMAILFRRSFCGLLCPFGGLQELFGRIGRKVLKKRFIIPVFIDKPLRYLKYLILLLTVGMAWNYGALWMSPYDPFSAYSHLSVITKYIQEDSLAIIGLLILAVTIVGSFIYDRFYCKYLCPVGAFYGIIGKISPTKIERNTDLCVNCKKCNKVCPVNIDIENSDKITSAECINCNECVLVCPKKGALEIKTAGKKMQPLAILLIVIGLFFGTILIAQATGNFQIMHSEQKESKSEESEDDCNEEVTHNLQDGSDKVDISRIRGSMTIQEASDSIQMDLDEFYNLFKIPESVPNQTRMKDIDNVSPGYDFDSIKEDLR